jgi:hypothetical protein
MFCRAGSLAISLLAVTVFAQADEPRVDYQSQIRPLLSNRCFKCHGPATQEGELRLDLRDAAVAAKAIVPERSGESSLVAKITATDESRMPPPETGDPLKPDEIATLRRWIDEGAEYTPHWAFVPPRAKPIPSVRNSAWPTNDIDYFVLDRMERASLSPSPEADRNTLIRRVSFDLLGLPPSVAEIDVYLADKSPDAYERMVDRLLASPHFGERQARYWLDAARYADSNGYTIDGPRSIWPWRDWVIRAINDDMPFDQFTIEQLGGDLLPNATMDQIVATGFHRNTSFNEEGGTDPEQFRAERTVDRTNTTGAVWLGLTVGCAQCHDHKYDPVSQADYFRLYAFFNAIEEREQSLPTSELEARVNALQKRLEETQAKPTETFAQTNIDIDQQVVKLREQKRDGYAHFAARDVRSTKGTQLQRLDDLSIVASGPSEAGETYVVEGWQRYKLISAIRVEALPPVDGKGEGVGLGRGEQGEFLLTGITLEAADKPLKFAKAFADREASGSEASKALGNDPNAGWSVGATKADDAGASIVFILEQPAVVSDSVNLRFTLKFGDKPSRAMTRFRISATNGESPFVNLPVVAQRLLEKPADQFVPADRDAISSELKAIAAALAKEESLQAIGKDLKAAREAVPTTLVCKEVAAPRQTYIHLRGDFLSRGPDVSPGVPASLSAGASGEPKTRLDLAKWLVDGKHPLTARVMVNRVWQQHFGRGLVDTDNDFGMQGALPTHPELLDTLAVWFAENGWSRKALHRLIMTSAAYRQSSAMRPEVVAVDPLNKLLARQQRLRIEAELVRDVALATSGRLTQSLGGPGVFPPQPIEVFAFTQNKRVWTESQGADRWKRGIYTYLWRQCQHPLMTTFDAPDAQTACTRRNRSNTPLQALHLANDPAFVELAEAFGERIVTEGPTDTRSRVAWAFRVALGRDPQIAELDRLETFAKNSTATDEKAIWSRVARVLFNLDEFISRE